jgi:DNA repair exonuclease SbcCD ATPase subunit
MTSTLLERAARAHDALAEVRENLPNPLDSLSERGRALAAQEIRQVDTLRADLWQIYKNLLPPVASRLEARQDERRDLLRRRRDLHAERERIGDPARIRTPGPERMHAWRNLQAIEAELASIDGALPIVDAQIADLEQRHEALTQRLEGLIEEARSLLPTSVSTVAP